MSNNHTPVPHKESAEPTLNWEKHLRWFAPLTAVILIAATAFMWMQGKSTSIRSEVLQAYAQATTADALVAVADAYPDQPEAPLARLQAAAMQFNEGEFEKALAEYEYFLLVFPSHAMANTAEWGSWMSQEAIGQLDEALAGFKSLTSTDLLYPQGLLGQARIMEKKGQTEDALVIYQTIQDEFSESNWAEQARVFAQRAKRTK